MALLSIDVGSTHCKAGLFAETGASLGTTSRATPWRHTDDGQTFGDPEELWHTVLAAIREVTAVSPAPVAAIGVAGMAESGLLLDRQSGRPRSAVIPWFDQTAAPQAARIRATGNPAERFTTFGIYPSFKCSLAKILALRAQDETITGNALWLHAADYIAYRLSGVMSTDYTLAGRTYAFDLAAKTWDEPWLAQFGLPADLFPPVRPSGDALARGLSEAWAGPNLAAGTPVAICGHDHICAAFAAGAGEPGVLFDSMGTAESLIGALPPRPLGPLEQQSGLTFGWHTARDQGYWLGGSAAAGGSVEWLRALLGDPPLTYAALDHLAEQMHTEPGDLIYLPYLSGRGAPWPDTAVRGAFVGLSARHGRAALLQAVLEGTAYQIEAIRRAAAAHLGAEGRRLVLGGGGVRNARWLQIKADICGCPLELLPTSEVTLLGAALLAGVGCGVFAGEREALAGTAVRPAATIWPSAARHQRYQHLYETRFLPLQVPLHAFFEEQPQEMFR